MKVRDTDAGVTPVDIVPAADEEQSLGRVDQRFQNIYAKNITCDTLTAITGSSSLRVSEDDGSPSYTDVNEITFEADYFTVTNPSAGTVKVNWNGLTVQDDDANPSYTGIHTLQFDQDDGFTISNPSAGVAKIDVTIPAGLTIEDIDSNPTVASVTTLRFDSADGLTVSTPGAGIARVDNDLTVTGVRRTYGNYGPVRTLTPLVDSGFSWNNQGTAAVTFTNGTCFYAGQGAGGPSIHSYMQAAPAGSYTCISAFVPFYRAGNYSVPGGIHLLRTSTGKLALCEVAVAGGVFTAQVTKMTNTTTWSSNTSFSITDGSHPLDGVWWLKYTTDTTNHTYSVSLDGGLNFWTILTETVATWFTTGAPDKIGFGSYGQNPTSNPDVYMTLISWSVA